MMLSRNNLNTTKEKVYFVVLFLLACVVWLGVPYWIYVSHNLIPLWIMLGIGSLLAFMTWLGNGLIVAYLRANCVKVDSTQFSQLGTALEEVCNRLGTRVPELYILQSNGFLNAFAMRQSGRDFVVLYSK